MADSTSPPLTLRLFGAFEAYRGEAPLPRMRTRKDQWLLALLALRPGAEVARTWLAGTLWPDSAEPAALANLRNALKDLRRALGPEAARLRCPTSRTLALDLTGAELDVHAFDAALRAGDPASLRRAVALYRGPLLEDCAEAWAFQERQAREQAYLAALDALATGALAENDAAAAERCLRRAIAVDPLGERAHRGLMQVLAAGGNYAAALHCYRELRQHLHRELNAEPDPETQTVFQQLRSEARRMSAKGSGFRRLIAGRGASGVGGIAATPILEEASPFPLPANNLLHPSPAGAPLTGLIGREREIAALQQQLDAGRLVTLTGPGGAGKTRLALHVTTDLRDSYPDGVVFVDLTPINDPALVASTIAQALGVREDPEQPLPDRLRASLWEKRLLLVLDNFEQVLPAAPLVAGLLANCPRLKALVTSRTPLRLDGEQELPVPPLALPPGGPDVGCRAWGVGSDKVGSADPYTRHPTPYTLMQYAAVQLFVQRARSVRPEFALTPSNAAAVGEICRRLDGLPLAIELAATRAGILTPQQMLTYLAQPLDLLRDRRQAVDPRHRSLRETLDWSYQLLLAEQQRCFTRLSVFRGGWTLEAADAVCRELAPPMNADELPTKTRESAPPVSPHPCASVFIGGSPTQSPVSGIQNTLDCLGQLRDCSLVIAEERGEEMRCRMLETIREFADEQLPREERAALRERHLHYYLALAEEAWEHFPSPEQGPWLDRVEADHDNLRAALAWSLESDAGAEAGLRLAGALQGFWVARGHWSEGRRWVEAVLARTPDAERTAARAGALCSAGWLAMNRGDQEGARPLLQESVAIYRELGHKRGVILSLRWLAYVARHLGDTATAAALWRENCALCREIDDRWLLIGQQAGLGQALGLDTEEGRALVEESLASAREVGHSQVIAANLRELGTMARERGDRETARLRFEECLLYWRQVSHRPGIAHALLCLADLALGRADWGEAGTRFAESLLLHREMDLMARVAVCLEGAGRVAAGRGQPERAARLLGATDAFCAATRCPLAWPFHDPAERERHISSVRAVLGEKAFAVAYAEGKMLSLEQAMGAALQESAVPAENERSL